MRYRLITESAESLDGMRLAGVDGCLVHDEAETEAAVSAACADEGVAVLLITSVAASWISQTVERLKLSGHRPLVTIIPSPGQNIGQEMISNLIRDAIGVKI